MFTINLGPFSGKTLLKYIIIHLSQIGYWKAQQLSVCFLASE